MSPKYIWQCSICGQGTTRKGSAIRHNDNLHSGSAMIVRPVEYIIGRLDGRFAPPNDPLSYRHNNKKRKQKDDNNLISSVRSHENYNNDDHFARNDNINKTFVAGMKREPVRRDHQDSPFLENIPMKNNNADRMESLRETLDQNRLSSNSPKLVVIKSKLEEFAILLNRHYGPQMASEFLARITDQLNNANGGDFLDEQLTWLRNIS
jgi:hypothetical protein